ncbi:unnamed protein product [Pieris macdunnoughi]|uniref:DDE Tnp4 domain-containing protein n=1 Tax=Pieris macdunnoughi TaxID=345717 RepID=A0A821X1Y5_9NEOP|nr:unnamed protein product [Pieris macdunnoughi]
MGRRFNNGTMNVPRPKLLPRTNDVTPHVLIGDEAFRLQAHVMKPFNQRVSRVDRRKEEYNKRLCRARRVVENAFGLLAQKWRIYFKPMHLKVSSAKKVIKATCVLHNYLRSKTCNTPYLQNMYFTTQQNNAMNNEYQNFETLQLSGDDDAGLSETAAPSVPAVAAASYVVTRYLAASSVRRRAWAPSRRRPHKSPAAAGGVRKYYALASPCLGERIMFVT